MKEIGIFALAFTLFAMLSTVYLNYGWASGTWFSVGEIGVSFRIALSAVCALFTAAKLS